MFIVIFDKEELVNIHLNCYKKIFINQNTKQLFLCPESLII